MTKHFEMILPNIEMKFSCFFHDFLIQLSDYLFLIPKFISSNLFTILLTFWCIIFHFKANQPKKLNNSNFNLENWIALLRKTERNIYCEERVVVTSFLS
ncbi:hypothetical protein BpHYR1_051540, partial [Brachionus plicatilis]